MDSTQIDRRYRMHHILLLCATLHVALTGYRLAIPRGSRGETSNQPLLSFNCFFFSLHTATYHDRRQDHARVYAHLVHSATPARSPTDSHAPHMIHSEGKAGGFPERGQREDQPPHTCCLHPQCGAGAQQKDWERDAAITHTVSTSREKKKKKKAETGWHSVIGKRPHRSKRTCTIPCNLGRALQTVAPLPHPCLTPNPAAGLGSLALPPRALSLPQYRTLNQLAMPALRLRLLSLSPSLDHSQGLICVASDPLPSARNQNANADAVSPCQKERK